MELSKSALRDFCDAAEALGMLIGSDHKGRVIKYADRNEALLGAVVDGDARKVQFFLDGGADVNYRDALQLAVSCDHVEVVKVLLRNGADLYRDTARKQLLPGGRGTPLVLASADGKLSIVQAILSCRSVAEVDKKEALFYADHHNHVQIVEALLEAGAKREFTPAKPDHKRLAQQG